MTDRRGRDESNRIAPDAPDAGELAGDATSLSEREERAMSQMLEAIGALARDEDGEIAASSAGASVAVSEGARANIVRKILDLQAHERDERQRAGAGTPGPTGSRASASPARHRLRRPLIAAAGFCAAALAVVLCLRPTPRAAVLPAYTVEARGGTKDLRGGAIGGVEDAREVAPTQRVRADSELVVTARPETSVVGPVTARAFRVQGADATELAPDARIAASGAVELRLRGSAVLRGASPGPAVLRVFVGRPEAVRALDPQAAARLPASGTPDDRRELTVPLDLDPM